MKQLYPADVDDMLALRQHFSSISDVQLWGGEGFKAPLTRARFMQQLQLPDTQSFVLQVAGSKVAFGQLCDRFSKHHLARLLVFPQARGRGYGRQLICALIRQGLADNPRLDFSLFVYKSNKIAVGLYRSMGFVESTQPQPHRDDLMFMVLPATIAKQQLAAL